MTRQPKPMSLDVLEAQVSGLRLVADDLKMAFNRIIQPSPRPATPDENDRFIASVMVMPIVIALAAELSLKAISIKRSGRPDGYKPTHDLSELYGELDDDTRSRIEQKAASESMASIERTLAEHKNDFVSWRYAGEEDMPLNTDPFSLAEAIAILRFVYEEIEPKDR